MQNSPFRPFSIKSAEFTTKHRLLQEDGFNHVIKAKSVSDKYFKIFFVRNNGSNARLGIIASKKMLPRAVDRNYAKRVVREIFRQHSVKDSNLDMVVMLRHAGVQQLVSQRGNLENLFSRVGN